MQQDVRAGVKWVKRLNVEAHVSARKLSHPALCLAEHCHALKLQNCDRNWADERFYSIHLCCFDHELRLKMHSDEVYGVVREILACQEWLASPYERS